MEEQTPPLAHGTSDERRAGVAKVGRRLADLMTAQRLGRELENGEHDSTTGHVGTLSIILVTIHECLEQILEELKSRE